MPKLFVIAGHGAGDPGAGGFGFNEAERVRHLATRMKALGGSMVELGDFSRNYYEDKGLNTLKVAPGTQIIELHMDSAGKDARGGHVIIKNGFAPDQYDKELALFISTMCPGRAETIVNRASLANVNRAAARGLPYRLLECCFISNRDDLDKFNKQTDDLARGILKSFGIGVAVPTQSVPVQLYQSNSTDAQKFSFEYTGKEKTINGNPAREVKIKNVATKKYLDVKGAAAKNNTAVQVHPRNGTKAQIWWEEIIQYDTDMYAYYHSALDESFVIDVPSGTTENRTKLHIFKKNESMAQRFCKVAATTKSYYIVNLGSGKSLDVVNAGR